jgi:hypothetical protein
MHVPPRRAVTGSLQYLTEQDRSTFICDDRRNVRRVKLPDDRIDLLGQVQLNAARLRGPVRLDTACPLSAACLPSEFGTILKIVEALIAFSA